MNDLLLSLAMAALGQLGGPGLGGPGLGGPGYGGPGYGGPVYGGPGYGAPGLGGLIPGLVRPGRIGLLPGPYGINGGYPGRPTPPAGLVPRTGGGSGPSPSLQLATATAARCLSSSGALPAADRQALLRHQGRLWGWPDGWQYSISQAQSDRLVARHGGCTPFLNALRDGRLRLGRTPGPTTIGQRPVGGSLPVPQRPSATSPSSEAEAFGLAPYR